MKLKNNLLFVIFFIASVPTINFSSQPNNTGSDTLETLKRRQLGGYSFSGPQVPYDAPVEKLPDEEETPTMEPSRLIQHPLTKDRIKQLPQKPSSQSWVDWVGSWFQPVTKRVSSVAAYGASCLPQSIQDFINGLSTTGKVAALSFTVASLAGAYNYQTMIKIVSDAYNNAPDLRQESNLTKAIIGAGLTGVTAFGLNKWDEANKEAIVQKGEIVAQTIIKNSLLKKATRDEISTLLNSNYSDDYLKNEDFHNVPLGALFLELSKSYSIDEPQQVKNINRNKEGIKNQAYNAYFKLLQLKDEKKAFPKSTTPTTKPPLAITNTE